MVLEVQRETGEKHGAVTRIAKQLGVGSESLRNWVRQAEVDSGQRPGDVIDGCAADRRVGAGES